MTYAVQTTSGKVTGARIKVLRVSEQLLGAVTEVEAKAEGHPNLATFQQVWAQQYGTFDPGEDVWVVEFKLVAAGHAGPKHGPLTAQEDGMSRGL